MLGIRVLASWSKVVKAFLSHSQELEAALEDAQEEIDAVQSDRAELRQELESVKRSIERDRQFMEVRDALQGLETESNYHLRSLVVRIYSQYCLIMNFPVARRMSCHYWNWI